VERLGASISVGVDDRCVLRSTEHRERYVSGLRLACTPQEPLYLRQPFFLLCQHANQRRDGGCVTIAEIALNAPITDLDHAEASDRKRVSCFHGSAPLSAETALPSVARAHDRICPTIGIGGHLAVPPLPHHRAYGSVPRRFDRVKLGQRHGVGGDRVSRNSGCAELVGPPGVRTCARTPSVNRRRLLH
jgi:hypothetical protein